MSTRRCGAAVGLSTRNHGATAHSWRQHGPAAVKWRGSEDLSHSEKAAVLEFVVAPCHTREPCPRSRSTACRVEPRLAPPEMAANESVLREELAALKTSQLMRRVKATGASQSQWFDAEDRRAALINLIVAFEVQSITGDEESGGGEDAGTDGNARANTEHDTEPVAAGAVAGAVAENTCYRPGDAIPNPGGIDLQLKTQKIQDLRQNLAEEKAERQRAERNAEESTAARLAAMQQQLDAERACRLRAETACQQQKKETVQLQKAIRHLRTELSNCTSASIPVLPFRAALETLEVVSLAVSNATEAETEDGSELCRQLTTNVVNSLSQLGTLAGADRPNEEGDRLPRSIIATAGGLTLALASMESQREKIAVQSSGCRLLFALSREPNLRAMIVASRAFCNASIC